MRRTFQLIGKKKYISLVTKSLASAFSLRLFVCATHHSPGKSQIDLPSGQLIGGFSLGFSNCYSPDISFPAT
jgi:hypothetical protein